VNVKKSFTALHIDPSTLPTAQLEQKGGGSSLQGTRYTQWMLQLASDLPDIFPLDSRPHPIPPDQEPLEGAARVYVEAKTMDLAYSAASISARVNSPHIRTTHDQVMHHTGRLAAVFMHFHASTLLEQGTCVYVYICLYIYACAVIHTSLARVCVCVCRCVGRPG
jgi:hypothetical protein